MDSANTILTEHIFNEPHYIFHSDSIKVVDKQIITLFTFFLVTGYAYVEQLVHFHTSWWRFVKGELYARTAGWRNIINRVARESNSLLRFHQHVSETDYAYFYITLCIYLCLFFVLVFYFNSYSLLFPFPFAFNITFTFGISFPFIITLYSLSLSLSLHYLCLCLYLSI